LVEVSKVNVLPPDKWLEPCVIVECEIKIPLNQCIVGINGLLLTEDGKIISRLEEIPDFLTQDNGIEIDYLVASDNAVWNKMVSSKTEKVSKFRFVAFLSQNAVDHIEKLREKRPKHDIELHLRFVLKYLVSYISTSHMREVEITSLPPQLKSEFEKIPSVEVGKKHPDSLIVYDFNSNFTTLRSNMWILSADSGAKFLALSKWEKEYTYRISYDDWVYDFLPKLKAYTTMTIEVPIIKEVPVYKHLAEAVDELKYGEKFLREGKYDEVIFSVRNVILNHLLNETEEVEVKDHKEKRRLLNKELEKVIIANVPRSAENDYKTVLNGVQEILNRMLQDHLSKFIHLDTGKLILMPLKADAEYLLLTITSIVKYLNELSLPPPK